MMKVMNVLVLLVVVLARGGRVVVEATNQTQEERRAVAKRLVESVLRKIGSAENSKIPDGTGYVLSEINGRCTPFHYGCLHTNNTRMTPRFRDSSDGNGYVFAFANDGTCLAHGQRPDEFVGRTTNEVIASSNPELLGKLDGDKLHTMMLEKAQAGGGWVTYSWITPTGVVYDKTSYVKQPTEPPFPLGLVYEDMYIGSGYNITSMEEAPAAAPTEE